MRQMTNGTTPAPAVAAAVPPLDPLRAQFVLPALRSLRSLLAHADVSVRRLTVYLLGQFVFSYLPLMFDAEMLADICFQLRLRATTDADADVRRHAAEVLDSMPDLILAYRRRFH